MASPYACSGGPRMPQGHRPWHLEEYPLPLAVWVSAGNAPPGTEGSEKGGEARSLCLFLSVSSGGPRGPLDALGDPGDLRGGRTDGGGMGGSREGKLTAHPRAAPAPLPGAPPLGGQTNELESGR